MGPVLVQPSLKGRTGTDAKKISQHEDGEHWNDHQILTLGTDQKKLIQAG